MSADHPNAGPLPRSCTAHMSEAHRRDFDVLLALFRQMVKRNRSGGFSTPKDEVSPWQENAIRALEDRSDE